MLTSARYGSCTQHCHRRGVIHRDCHPVNIIWSPDKSVLIDFGIARLARGGQQQTAAELLLGTPPFIAPEQQQPFDAEPTGVYALYQVLRCFWS